MEAWPSTSSRSSSKSLGAMNWVPKMVQAQRAWEKLTSQRSACEYVREVPVSSSPVTAMASDEGERIATRAPSRRRALNSLAGAARGARDEITHEKIDKKSKWEEAMRTGGDAKTSEILNIFLRRSDGEGSISYHDRQSRR